MPKIVSEFRSVGELLWESGLVSSHGGNLSIRRRGGTVIVTRTGCPLARIGNSDLVKVAVDGSVSVGDQPSMDTPIHRGIYAAIGEFRAEAVVHAHPRHAIALSLDQDLIEPDDLEGKFYLGSVPIVVADKVVEALQSAPIAVVRGHGSYARGSDLLEALKWTSILEESAEVLWLRQMLAR